MLSLRARKALTWGERLLATTALAGTFLVAAGAGVVLHADLPLSRAFAARISGEALTSLLAGKVELQPFSHIGLTQVRLPGVVLLDAQGHRVLALKDVRADVSARVLLHDLFFQRERLTIIVGHVRVEHTDVDILRDPASGEPTIVRALAPRPSAGPAAGSGASDSAGARVFLPSVELGIVDVHARFPEQPPVESRIRNVHGQLLGSPKGLAVDIDRFGVVVHRDSVEARGTGTLAIRAPGPVRGTFDGFVGDVELTMRAFIDGSHVDAALDILDATPAAVAHFVPGWPVREPVAGHVDVTGDLPRLVARGRLRAAGTSIGARAEIALGNAPSATVTVQGRHLDARLFDEAAPETDLKLDGTARIHTESGTMTVDVAAHTAETRIAGQQLPAADVRATILGGVTSGTLDVRDRQSPVTASFEVSPKGVVDVDARTGTLGLDQLARVGVQGLHGAGTARVRAHTDHGALRATIDVDASGVTAPKVSVARAKVTAHVTGRLDALGALKGTLHVEGRGLTVSGVSVEKFDADGRGTRESLAFTAHTAGADSPELTAQGTALLGDHPTLRDTHVSLRRDPVVIEGTVEALNIETGSVEIHDVRVTGAGGTVTGALRFGPGLVEVEAEGENVDLDAVGRALGLPRGVLTGKMRISTNLASGKDVTRGRLRLGLGNTTLGPVGGVSMQVSADLDGGQLTGGASGLVAGLGTFGATWDTALPGRVLDPASWRDITGRAELQVSDVRLGMLAVLLPKGGPIDNVGGRAYGKLLFERKTADAKVPGVFATFATRELTVDLAGKDGAAGAHVAGIDLSGTGAFDAGTGSSTGTTVALDDQGELLAATGAIRVDVDRLLRDPAGAIAQLVDTPLDLVVSVPRRDVGLLPALVRPPAIAGAVSANVGVRGTLAHPTLFASVDGTDVTSADRSGRPVDVHADGQYEWVSRAISARGAVSLASRPVATGTFRGVLPEGAASGWAGDGKIDLSSLPLDLLGVLGRSQMNGQLFGSATFSRHDGKGTLGAAVRIEDAVVEHTALGRGRVSFVTDGPVVRAQLAFSGEHGSLDATGSAGMSWAGVLPELSHSSPIEARVSARDFAAVALSPLVSGVLTRLGGHLDAELGIELQPAPEGAAEAWTGGIRGSATLRDGTVLIDTLGLEVRDLACSVDAQGSGATTNLSVRDVRGSVRASRDNLHGSADLVLDGLRLTRGTATLDADDAPILFHGVPQGRVTGHVDAKLAREGKLMVVDLDVPRLTTVLPRASTRDVIALDENPDVKIIQKQAEVESSDALPWRLSVHLGNEVALRRSDVDLSVTGTPVIELGDETAVSGSIELVPGGRVPVLGKVFSVEQGQVVFDTGEPTNPRIDVRAAWRAPTDTVVYVEVTGTLNDAKIALRSDPPMTEPEVFALILGGSSSDPNATADSSQGSASAAAGAAALSTGFSQLGQLIQNNPVELRVEATSQAQPRYTAAVRVRPNLWFEASEYQQSDYGVGTGSDRNVFSGTVDYRFTHRWSLRTEVGTAGGAMDLLWRYRY